MFNVAKIRKNVINDGKDYTYITFRLLGVLPIKFKLAKDQAIDMSEYILKYYEEAK